jgi:predicted RNA binding protein YcfA (HicA-like mRNA interferase family)
MSPRLPQVSGATVVKLLQELGYEVTRQRGSHIRLNREAAGEVHHVTVPAHRVIAKGTLSDILTAVSRVSSVPKSELIERLRRL